VGVGLDPAKLAGTRRAAPGAPVRSWSALEPGFAEFVGEASRLFRRARHRRWSVLGITLLLVGLLAVRQMRRDRSYPASVVLSATEGRDDEAGVAHASAKLQDYIYYAVFTDSALLEIMREHGYRPDLIDVNPRLALDNFRDDLDVDVYKNEFLQPRMGGVPRSARFAIEFRAPDPDQAIAIARALGDRVIARDAENRKERLSVELGLASEILGYARADVDRTERELAQAVLELEEAVGREAAVLRVRVQKLDAALTGARARLDQAQATHKQLRNASAADAHSLTLRYERVDWGAPKLKVDERLAMLRVLLVAFLGVLPLVAMGVGAFDPCLYEPGDVRRLGLRPLGVVRTQAGAAGERRGTARG
jgi:hypothetical protein